MPRYIELHFSTETEVSLVSTRCSLDGKSIEDLRSSRQQYSRFLQGEGSFGWTKGVQALCFALLGYKLRCLSADRSSTVLQQPLLVGRRPSNASCLDDAIYKRPQWLIDMFGVDVSGRSRARRIFVIENTGGKLPGPIKIGINTNYLRPENICVFNETGLVSTEEKLRAVFSSLAKPCLEGEIAQTDMSSDIFTASG